MSIPRFDPVLGELREVDVTIDGHLDATLHVENLAAAPATLTSRLSALVTVARPAPGGAVIGSAHPSVVRNDDLAQYDGTTDHAGPSGHTATVIGDHSSATTLTDLADLALFTGTTPIVLPTSGTDTSVDPPAPVDADLDTAVGAAVTVTYTYVSDTRPPDPPTIVTSPPAYTADSAPVVTFLAELGTVTECRLDPPADTGPWGACTSPWIGDLAAGPDGPYTFNVRATDPAGNIGTPATRTFTLDRVAPGQPTLTFVPPALGQSPSPTWAFTIESGATARCNLDGTITAPCSSPFTADLLLAPDGPHVFRVRAVDAAGNLSAFATHTYTLDRQAPQPPTITSPPASPGNDPTPTWGLQLAPDATAASCSVDGGPFVACGTSLTADLSSAADGLHTVAVRNADAAGNQSAPVTGTYLLDRAAPGSPTLSGPPSPSNDATPTWGISTEAGSTVECRLDAGAWVPCAGTFSASFGPGSDGVHVLAVRATDAAGNVGAAATSAYTLDTTPPGAPVIATSPADPSNSPTPIWTFTVDTDSAATCSLDGGAWTSCTSPHQADLSGAADGPHSLAVRATDPYGNTGPATTRGFTLDRTAPTAPSITAAPSSPGAQASVSWSFTTPDGTSTRCRLDGGPSVACAESFAATLAADGIHGFEVVAVDPAGNQSAPAIATYTLDRQAPVAPTITGSPTSPDRFTTPRWTFSVEPLSAGECSINGGPWVACAVGFSADLSAAADGPHTFAVRSVDAAGNVGASTTSTFVLDRTPPGTPVLTGGPEADSQDDTPTWTFSVDGGATAECRVDDGAWEPCDGSFAADLTGVADGIHALEVRATDGVGNVGPTLVATYALDRLAPEPAAFTTVPLSPGNTTIATWHFDHEPGTTSWCSLDGASATACDAAFTTELASDGMHELVVVVTDAAGNSSGPSTSVYELDTVAPAAPVVVAPASPDMDEQPEWSIEVEPGSVAECSFDGSELAACGAVFAVDLAGLDGTHLLLVQARDAAGNVSELVTSAYVLDTVAPSAPVMQHTPDAAAWVWRFTLESGATAECSVDGGPWAPCTSPRPGGPADRTVRFEVRAVDRAGNRSAITRTTVTPTLGLAGPAAEPPPKPPRALSAPDPLPGPSSPVVAVGPRGASRPPVSALAPSGRSGAEVESRTVIRRFRPPDGPFAGPVRDLLKAAAESTTIPVLVILIVLGFVAVQNRIDRQDPKLAAAPLRHEPEYLEFE